MRNRRVIDDTQIRYEIIRTVNASKLVERSFSDTFEVPYVSINKFGDFPIVDQIKRNITDKQYSSPTPIQDQAIPAILAGKDVVGIANTGTGKTAAFLIPLIDKVFKDRNQKVFIVTPTRELALQIDEEFKSFSRGLGLFSAICIGGANINRQIHDLRKYPNFVIGTPGRIKDLIGERALNLAYFNNVVLDETDRMVDIGFINDIMYFIKLLPLSRQSLFFSATISNKVQLVINTLVNNPVLISVKQKETVDAIKQEIIEVKDKQQKINILHDLLIQESFEKILIFGRTKWGVQKLADELVRRGFKAGAIHGNKRQNQRQKTLQQFKNNEIKILLATDVASRGLDIENISHVINFDIPSTFDDYIHRIGRTGRANKGGVALTFI